MDPAALIFAAASLPILVFHSAWYREERQMESLYGIFSGIFAFSGALLVTAGFPGSMILPGTFGILALGSLHAYLREKERKKAVKFAVFLAISLGIVLLEVML